MPLSLAPTDRSLRVIKVLADEKVKKHLEALGITVNSEIRILDQSGGSIICFVKDGKLALDKSMATKILVA